MVAVQPGCEAWSAEGGDVGALVLHGFTGSPAGVRPLAEALAAAGYAVELPRLPGHGTNWRDLAKTRWPDWADAAGAALQTLAARTRTRVVVGLSVGGALALQLAQTRAGDLGGLVLVNPSVYATDWRAPALPVLKWLWPAVSGIGNDIARRGADERPSRFRPLKAADSVQALHRRVLAGLPRVTAPTLVFTSRVDHVVEPGNSRVVLDGISSADKVQVWLERSYHVATLDHDAEVIVEQTLAFLKRVTGE